MMSSPPPSSPTRHLASLVAVHLGTVGRRGRLSCSQRKRDTYKTSLPKLISHTNTVCTLPRDRERCPARVTCTGPPPWHEIQLRACSADPSKPNVRLRTVPPAPCELRTPGAAALGSTALRPCAMRPTQRHSPMRHAPPPRASADPRPAPPRSLTHTVPYGRHAEPHFRPPLLLCSAERLLIRRSANWANDQPIGLMISQLGQ